MTCTTEGYRNASELVRCRSSVKCLNIVGVIIGVHSASFANSTFGFQRWRVVK
jgi:hypothetical protein